MSDYKHGNWFAKPANYEEAREIIERAVASGATLVDKIGVDLAWSYPWNMYPHWGVYDGKTNTSDASVIHEVTGYTIEQVREKFPLPSELDKSLPPIHDTYQHTNGGVYRVTGYANEKTTKPEQYPVNIIYQNVVNGTIWCRPASEWARSFTPVDSEPSQDWDGEELPHAGQRVEIDMGNRSSKRRKNGETGRVLSVSINSIGRTMVMIEIDGACGECDAIVIDCLRPFRSKRDQWVENALRILQKDPSAMPKQLMSMIYDALKSGDLKAPE